MSTATATPEGLRKAAILLIALGRDQASTVLSRLRESEVEALSMEIARCENIGATQTKQVLDQFRELARERAYVTQGGLSFAQDLLEASLGDERAGSIMGRLSATALQMPFQFLHRADPRQLLSFIADEHPQVIALVLAHMTAEKASLVLSGLGPERQAEVAHRIAVMDRTSPTIIRQVESLLERKLSSVLAPAELSVVGGVDPLVDIINRSDRATERLIVEGLESRDPELAEEVKARMFVFEDITSLDDRSIQQVLRQVDTADLAMALKGVSDEVRAKVTDNLSERAATTLLEEVDLLGQVRLRQVEEAQQKVIRAIRELEESGQIVVRRSGDDEFVV
ncbi:MAG: flagellar motor switch protein FliG [Nocardioidaceae bacterium]